jgi:D-3-phosphoglycerate dehydrogenase
VAERVVALLEPVPDDGTRDELVAMLAPHATLAEYDVVPSGPGILALIAGPDVPVSAQQAQLLPDLRVVAAPSTGFDHLDVEAITAQGAWVTNVRDYCTDEVADHALALAIDLLRGVTLGDRAVRRGEWPVAPGTRRCIAGARLGLVGFGRIARAFAERALALGMQVHAYDPHIGEHDWPGESVSRAAALHDVLAWADVVSLHAPLTDQTRALIDAAALDQMRAGAMLVNVARGGLVDQAALVASIEAGHLSGAALDVLQIEPVPPHDPVLSCDHIVLTPHVGWQSPQAQGRGLLAAAGQVLSVLAGGEPSDAVGRAHLSAAVGHACLID